jgi:hypothetical protein
MMLCVLVCCVLQVPWCEQEEGALGGQGDAQQEVGIQVGSAVLAVGAAYSTAHCLQCHSCAGSSTEAAAAHGNSAQQQQLLVSLKQHDVTTWFWVREKCLCWQ